MSARRVAVRSLDRCMYVDQNEIGAAAISEAVDRVLANIEEEHAAGSCPPMLTGHGHWQRWFSDHTFRRLPTVPRPVKMVPCCRNLISTTADECGGDERARQFSREGDVTPPQ